MSKLNELPYPKYIIDKEVRKFKPYRYIAQEDLFQIGYEGYLNACKKHDTKLGPMKYAFAATYIYKYLHAAWDKVRKWKDATVPLCNEEYFGGKKSAVENELVLKEIETICLTHLDRDERYIVLNYYKSKNGLTLTELGEKLGLTRRQVGIIKKRALAKIKDVVHEV